MTVMVTGTIIDSWCSNHGDNGKNTPHYYDPHARQPLRCMECYPEAEKEPEVKKK